MTSVRELKQLGIEPWPKNSTNLPWDVLSGISPSFHSLGQGRTLPIENGAEWVLTDKISYCCICVIHTPGKKELLVSHLEDFSHEFLGYLERQGVHQKTRELVLVYGSLSKEHHELISLAQQGRWGMMVNRKTGILKIARIKPSKDILTYQAFKV